MSDRPPFDMAAALREFNEHTGKVLQGQPINRETGIPDWALELREKLYVKPTPEPVGPPETPVAVEVASVPEADLEVETSTYKRRHNARRAPRTHRIPEKA